MSDADALRDVVAGELLLVPGVRGLHPPRPVDAPLVALAAAGALIGAAAEEEGVVVLPGRIEASVGVEGTGSALGTGLDCVRTVRDLLPASRAGATVRIRVVAVD